MRICVCVCLYGMHLWYMLMWICCYTCLCMHLDARRESWFLLSYSLPFISETGSLIVPGLSPSNYLVYPSHSTEAMGACCFTQLFPTWVWPFGLKNSCLASSILALAGIYPTPGKDFLEEPQIDQSVREDLWPLDTCSLYFNSWSLLIIPNRTHFFYIIFKKQKYIKQHNCKLHFPQ